MVGFCFGGFAALVGSQTGALSCAIGVHSSFKIFNFHGSTEAAEVDKCLCPMMVLQAENDLANTKPKGELEALLKEKNFGSECVFYEFEEQVHGWCVRGDLDIPAVKRDVGLAMEMIVSFANKHVHDQVISTGCSCPCAVCTCGPDCKCAPQNGPGCDPCKSFMKTMKEATSK